MHKYKYISRLVDMCIVVHIFRYTLVLGCNTYIMYAFVYKQGYVCVFCFVPSLTKFGLMLKDLR
jgi:hypothetical protein